jgi:hypothetical protein
VNQPCSIDSSDPLLGLVAILWHQWFISILIEFKSDLQLTFHTTPRTSPPLSISHHIYTNSLLYSSWWQSLLLHFEVYQSSLILNLLFYHYRMTLNVTTQLHVSLSYDIDCYSATGASALKKREIERCWSLVYMPRGPLLGLVLPPAWFPRWLILVRLVLGGN